MRTKLVWLIFFLFGTALSIYAESFSAFETDSAFYFYAEEDIFIADLCASSSLDVQTNTSKIQHSKLAIKYQDAFKENKRLTAAMLTFALGMLGVHRLYLGTQPWIPAVYLLTFGGGFLILPLIDLGVILFCKDLSKYEHNDRVLMWVK